MHKLDIGKGRLRKLVSKAVPATPKLPLVHSTDAYSLREALADDNLEPVDCNVFLGEALIYTFYGRPAFRPNNSEQPTSLGHYLPVCLIFKLDFTQEIKRIFPFDSGGFHNDFYRQYMHKRMTLGDFALETAAETPGKVISTFFGSASDYMRGSPNQSVQIDETEFEAQSYAALVGSKGANTVDSRGSGIEVQFSDPISISTWVQAVIVPSTFMESEVGSTLENLGIEVVPYSVFNRLSPNEYTSSISDVCLRYYIGKGIVPEPGR